MQPSRLTGPPPLGAIAIFQPRIAKISGLAAALGATELVLKPTAARAKHLTAVVGWGHRPTTRSARRFAETHGLPFLRLEDGFFRSVLPGSKSPPLSLIVDDAGIYYDASQPSTLETWLNAESDGDPLKDPALLDRAQRLVDYVVTHEVSKYNHAVGSMPAWLLGETRKLVLVVDQSRGDQSVKNGLADASSFERMLEAALSEHPDALVLVKTHPDVRLRGKRSYYTEAALSRHPASARLRLLVEAVNPIALLKVVSHVYVGTSQLGFEALMLQKPVTCFGGGFYSGWGLTDDRVSIPRRTRRRTLVELAAAALLLYPRYLHPRTRTVCSAEVVVEHLALQRQRFLENRGTLYCFGFTQWKHGFVKQYLQSPGSNVRFCRSLNQVDPEHLRKGARFVAWGQNKPDGLEALAKRCGVAVETMEDGFLRSIGLGSDFTLPLSLVLDRRGIYFDPTRPSDLEELLEHRTFTPSELTRAAALRERIVASGLSKYNLSGNEALKLRAREGQRVILVPGQVEDDASIRLGADPECRTNALLLAATRRCDPAAYIVYKPHPEVLSGNRKAQPVPESAYDHLVENAPLSQCLDVADAVHTMTSLVGFEALLRGLEVVAHGRPFYSGWGLTVDRVANHNRTRKLTLNELVAGALLCYPRYFDYTARAFVNVEDAVDELLEQRRTHAALPPRASRVQRQLSRLWNLLKDVTHAG